MTDITIIAQPAFRAVEIVSRASQGVPGISAYEIARRAGYQGTELEWIDLIEHAAPLAAQAQESADAIEQARQEVVTAKEQAHSSRVAAGEFAETAQAAANTASEQAVIASAILPAFASMAADIVRTQIIIINNHGFN